MTLPMIAAASIRLRLREAQPSLLAVVTLVIFLLGPLNETLVDARRDLDLPTWQGETHRVRAGVHSTSSPSSHGGSHGGSSSASSHEKSGDPAQSKKRYGGDCESRVSVLESQVDELLQREQSAEKATLEETRKVRETCSRMLGEKQAELEKSLEVLALIHDELMRDVKTSWTVGETEALKAREARLLAILRNPQAVLKSNQAAQHMEGDREFEDAMLAMNKQQQRGTADSAAWDNAATSGVHGGKGPSDAAKPGGAAVPKKAPACRPGHYCAEEGASWEILDHLRIHGQGVDLITNQKQFHVFNASTGQVEFRDYLSYTLGNETVEYQFPATLFELLPYEEPELHYATCAVVGNSGVVLEKENGENIDRHDAVFRINLAPVEGFEKYVGSKTTFNVVNAHNVQEILQVGSKNSHTSTKEKTIIPATATQVLGKKQSSQQ
eukprot:jgi/Mesvir1/10085/Mv25061-RA.1